MSVEALTLDPTTKTPIVILRDEDDDLSLPIWVGILEATSLATQLEGVSLARPMTHDLLRRFIEEVGATVSRVEITELRDNTFYALIHLKNADGEVRQIDSRPSDAISLALRTDSPIYVSQQVIEAAAIPAGEAEEIEELEVEADDPMADLSEVDPDRWSEILEGLDPEEFKYKM
jgi:bifunctional DNase/RNase